MKFSAPLRSKLDQAVLHIETPLIYYGRSGLLVRVNGFAKSASWSCF